MNRCGSLTASDYRAGSWSRPRIIIYKAEITQGKTNPRFVVTNIRNRTPKFLYEKVYCARGRMEGFIKNHKTFLHSAAYVLVHAIKQIGMQGTQWTTSNFDTIQLRVLKIGARVREHATRISLSLSDVVSPQGLDEDDRPQPRHGVNAHTDGRCAKNSITSTTKGSLRSNERLYGLTQRPPIMKHGPDNHS